MLLTALVIVIFLALFAIGGAVWSSALKVGLKWVKAPRIRWWDLLLVTFSSQIVLPVLLLLFAQGPELHPDQVQMRQLVGSLVVWVVTLGLIQWRFRLTWVKTFFAWLPTVAASVAMMTIARFLFVSWVIEAYAISGMSMAPTLWGPHRMTVCPTCGAPAAAGYRRPESFMDHEDPDAMCQHFHITPTSHLESPPQSSDKILVAKFLQPRRWDIAVFREPVNPGNTFIFRVVGLPGEEIFIDEGAVWVNGARLTLPAALQGMTYTESVDNSRNSISREQPARLGADEYFVLGDNTANSNDSRLWTKGAPGHAAWAVPADHMLGVATHTYWPPGRMRRLRPADRR